MGYQGAGEIGHLPPAPVIVARGQRHGGGVGVGAERLAGGRRVDRGAKARQVADDQVAAEADPVEHPRTQAERVDDVEETDPETDHLAEAGAVEPAQALPGALQVLDYRSHVVTELLGRGGAGRTGAAEKPQGKAAHRVAEVGDVEGVEIVFGSPSARRPPRSSPAHPAATDRT